MSKLTSFKTIGKNWGLTPLYGMLIFGISSGIITGIHALGKPEIIDAIKKTESYTQIKRNQTLNFYTEDKLVNEKKNDFFKYYISNN